MGVLKALERGKSCPKQISCTLWTRKNHNKRSLEKKKINRRKANPLSQAGRFTLIKVWMENSTWDQAIWGTYHKGQTLLHAQLINNVSWI